jgi:uncharacterized protein DUF397
MSTFEKAIWFKSRASSAQGECVEVAFDKSADCSAVVVGIRDSKNPQQGHFAVPPAAWKAFLTAATE